MEETKLGKTLLGGDKNIGFLDKKAVDRLAWFIDDDSDFIVSDNLGADLAWQNHLNSIGYRNVTVYYHGDTPQFNLGEWSTKQVLNREEITDAESSFFLWDGCSKDTKLVMLELKNSGKPVMVYRADIDEIRIISRRMKMKEKYKRR